MRKYHPDSLSDLIYDALNANSMVNPEPGSSNDRRCVGALLSLTEDEGEDAGDPVLDIKFLAPRRKNSPELMDMAPTAPALFVPDKMLWDADGETTPESVQAVAVLLSNFYGGPPEEEKQPEPTNDQSGEPG